MMKFLVTGGVGFIGTNLIKRLLKDGHEVISVDNYSTGKKENEQDGCTYYNVDISNPRWWDFSTTDMCEVTCDCQIDKVDGIFHLAALARIQPSFEEPQSVYESNVTGTQNIIEWSRNNGNIPIVYAGSSSVHGDHFANPYTFTKWQGELLVELYSKVFNVPSCICRFYNVYGEHQITDGAYCAVIGIFEKQFKKGTPLTVTGDGEQRRDFTYVGDIVDGIVKSMTAMHGEIDMRYCAETFELGNGTNHSINELAEAFGGYPIEHIDARPGEMRETLNTDTKAREVLGWKPTGDVIKFIKETYILDK